jgi:2-hydroxy-3-oxopropionate reductase
MKRMKRMKKVGFIGLGNMGKPMAKNLLKAGFPLTVYNRTKSKTTELGEMGAKIAASPKEVAENSDVVVSCVTDSASVEAITLGPDGIIEGARKGLTYIDCSTISPVATKKIAETLVGKGVKMLDAPISGGVKGAIEGTLAIMVGGEKKVFEESMDVFQGMGKNIVYIGETGMGQVCKACNQMIAAGTLAGISEAFVLGTKAGIDPELMHSVLGKGVNRSWYMENVTPEIIKRNFKAGFSLANFYKDLGIALSAGKSIGTPLMVVSLIHEIMGSLMTEGLGPDDCRSFVKFYEKLAKTEVKTK